MAMSNRDRVDRVMMALKEGLGPFVLREFRLVYQQNLLKTFNDILSTAAFEFPVDEMTVDPENALLRSVDTQGWLKLMWARWNEVFKRTLGHAERSYVSELLETRNQLAHQASFSNDAAYRVADTATLLLKAVNAPEQAEDTYQIAQDLLRLRFEAEAKKSKRQTATL